MLSSAMGSSSTTARLTEQHSHLPRDLGTSLTANENSGCHSCHCIWGITEVQYVSRELVEAVYCIFEHEGNQYIHGLKA